MAAERRLNELKSLILTSVTVSSGASRGHAEVGSQMPALWLFTYRSQDSTAFAYEAEISKTEL